MLHSILENNDATLIGDSNICRTAMCLGISITSFLIKILSPNFIYNEKH